MRGVEIVEGGCEEVVGGYEEVEGGCEDVEGGWNAVVRGCAVVEMGRETATGVEVGGAVVELAAGHIPGQQYYNSMPTSQYTCHTCNVSTYHTVYKIK